MKKLIVALCLIGTTISSPVLAWNHGYYGYRAPVYVNNYGHSNSWVAPALAGAVVGGMVARSYYAPPATYVQQPVYVQPQPNVVYVQQPGPLNYHQETILDANCNCYRAVWVPN